MTPSEKRIALYKAGSGYCCITVDGKPPVLEGWKLVDSWPDNLKNITRIDHVTGDMIELQVFSGKVTVMSVRSNENARG